MWDVIMPLRRYWQLLARYLAPQRGGMLLLALLLLGGIALELLGPQLLRDFLDRAQRGDALRDLRTVALLFGGVALLAQGATVAEAYLAESIGWTATNELRADLAAHCLHLDPSFHHAHTPGELMARIDGDVSALANFFSRFVLSILGSALLLLGVLALLWREDWRIGLGVGLFAGITLATMLRLYAVARPLWRAVEQEGALFYGFIGERLAGLEDLRTSGPIATAYVLRRLAERLRTWVRLLLRAVFAGQAVWMVALTLFALANALALTVATGLFRVGAASIGTIYLIVAYVGLLIRPIARLQAEIADLQQAGASIDRVEELFAMRPAITDGPGTALPTGALSVACRDVSFSYGGASVLRDLSFALAPGHVLGLLGRTGSGKTTLARQLVRFHDPTSGTVTLGGVDLRAAHVADIRARVGLVTQEVQLFAASVRDNLTFFNPAIPDARLLAAIDQLGLRAWFTTLPAGLDTILAPGGDLSAGEAQLLALVRIFLRDPGLVILDEASARLDPATERLIERAIERLLTGRTGIIIAHRLATLRRVDSVLILEDGRIVEQGARTDLARDPASRFARLLATGSDTAAPDDPTEVLA
jgi:ABC-type multidrug transport system fused ATPase/permease subunit